MRHFSMSRFFYGDRFFFLMRFLPCHHFKIYVQLSLQPQKKSTGKLRASFSCVVLGNKHDSTFSME